MNVPASSPSVHPSSAAPANQPRPGAPTGLGRGTLAGRIRLLAVGIAVLTALLAGLLAVGLTRSSAEQAARQLLSRIADGAADRAGTGVTPTVAQNRAVRTLGAIGVQTASVTRAGQVSASNPLARAALTPARQRQLLSGQSISARDDITGISVLVEGRPTDAGGILVVQRRVDATADADRLVRRVLIALLIAAAVAIAVSAVVARRLARPLLRTASAAQALAGGERAVAVPVEGPREVAAVAHALNELSVSLGHSEQRQRDFLLSVSHDLRTPLTGITGYAESLAEGVIPAEDSQRVGAVVLGESRRLERLVSDLLDLARLRADHPRLELHPVDLVGLGRDVEQVWSQRCGNVGVEFAFVADVATAVTTTDAARVRQLLDGLLENALRVTPSRRPIIVQLGRDVDANIGPSDLRGGAAPRAAGWRIEVRDGGPGLTDDDISVAFEPSVLHERYRGIRPVGTGLGLAIVGRLATLVGGSIEAGHAPEGGACFTLRLPA